MVCQGVLRIVSQELTYRDMVLQAITESKHTHIYHIDWCEVQRSSEKCLDVGIASQARLAFGRFTWRCDQGF